MFGPFDETNTATNQLWAFKNKRAVWSQINPEYIYNNPIWPSASSDFSMSMSQGYSILQSSTTIYNHIVIMIGCDGNACTNQIYVMSQDDCNQSYINNGECRYGYFICNENYYDNDCSSPMCPGSICLYNSDTFDAPYCIYCKGQGSCSGGTCSCSQILYTEGNLYFENSNCENVDCYKSCSNQGDCISYFPENQCRCDQEDQIGGDNCENIFCLNDCSDHGTCSNGICSCDNSDQNYLGADS
ncbi:hypothetical protein PPERSA_09016 [Pseudocohnilembus persalinus]|uniref:Uncharacterized protein n=1 Tax=Pseudocohnilembus persalinus TaxID=266149 RepID=A0A0V0R3K7_PSEPJ|nr:hypothetical protein PPERSA_09016 [Pseudocohnilembus persalinus]|eukprot:KRX08912.1 hypothetical protein PPERSA_09016 [Pseudocohnilembus persalinus]